MHLVKFIIMRWAGPPAFHWTDKIMLKIVAAFHILKKKEQK